MLNKKQQEVVNHSNGSLVNIAGPGSGKTHTLIEKIKHLIEIEDISVLDKTLVLTFTNSAAHEIRDRALKNFKYTNPHSLYFGTYHGIFKRILSEEKIFLDLGFGMSPTLISPNETERNLSNTLKNNFESSFASIANDCVKEAQKTNKDSRSAKSLTNTLFKNHIIDTKNLLKMLDNMFNNYTANDMIATFSYDDLIDKIKEDLLDKCFTQFDNERENKMLNHDNTSVFGLFFLDKISNDFLVKTFKRFFKDQINSFFDEKIEQKIITFSDIILLTLFALTYNNKLKVIMQNRFKHIFIDEFQDTNTIQGEILKIIHKNNICVIGDPYQSIYGFLGSKITNIINSSAIFNANVIQLDENYRSTREIVGFTNSLAIRMEDKIEGWIPNKSSSKLPSNKIKLLPYTDKDLQRDYVIDKILNTPKDKTVGILNRRGNDFLTEQYLAKNKIEFKKLGGLTLKESVEVQCLSSLYTFILDNKKTNALSYFLPRVVGIGEKSVENYILSIKNKTNKKPSKKIGLFLDELFNRVNMQQNLISDTNDNNKVFLLTKQVSEIYFEFIFPKISKNWKPERQNLAKQKVNVIVDEIAEQKDGKDILTVLDNYYLDNKEKKEVISNVTLSTIHSAKGLEWDIVFLIDWHMGSFEKDFFNEAQRLNYVAVSRAKSELHILAEEDIFELNRGYVENNPSHFEQIRHTFVSRTPKHELGVLRFGKYKGKHFSEIPKSYLYWVYDNGSDFLSKKLLSQEDVSLLKETLFSA